MFVSGRQPTRGAASARLERSGCWSTHAHGRRGVAKGAPVRREGRVSPRRTVETVATQSNTKSRPERCSGRVAFGLVSYCRLPDDSPVPPEPEVLREFIAPPPEEPPEERPTVPCPEPLVR